MLTSTSMIRPGITESIFCLFQWYVPVFIVVQYFKTYSKRLSITEYVLWPTSLAEFRVLDHTILVVVELIEKFQDFFFRHGSSLGQHRHAYEQFLSRYAPVIVFV